MDAEMYGRALGKTGAVVAVTRRDQFDDATPCGDWNVRDLLNHIIGGCVSYAAGAAGRRVEISDGTNHVADDHVGSYERAARAALDAFSAPGALERNFSLPTGDTPGALALGLALAEAAVHGWDLARATGQEYTIDADTPDALYGMTTRMMAPKGPYPRGDSFKDSVEISGESSPSDRLLAYLGRHP